MQGIKLIAGANEKSELLKSSLEQLPKQLKNPFTHIKKWTKDEAMNLESLIAAIAEKEACASRKSKAIKLLATERDLVDKIGQNKFHFKLLLKSQEAKQRFALELQSRMKERE